jgi:hypothetical protein
MPEQIRTLISRANAPTAQAKETKDDISNSASFGKTANSRRRTSQTPPSHVPLVILSPAPLLTMKTSL